MDYNDAINIFLIEIYCYNSIKQEANKVDFIYTIHRRSDLSCNHFAISIFKHKIQPM